MLEMFAGKELLETSCIIMKLSCSIESSAGGYHVG